MKTREFITFTTLRELRDWLIDLDQEQLDALTNEADWFTAYSSRYKHGNYYFHIEPHNGGEE